MIKAYYKLIRDKIPAILKKKKIKFITKKINKNKINYYLKLKLKEEVYEILEANQEQDIINEIADIYEIIEAILKQYKISNKKVINYKKQKKKLKGGFDKKILLISTEE